jgi:NADPH2:quinone reductase
MSSDLMTFIEVVDGSLAQRERPRPVPRAGEVLIEVAASGINRADLAQRAGRYPPPPGASDILGLEVSGKIAALGDGVSRLEVGMPVCALLAGGGYASHCIVPAGQVAPLPRGIGLVEGAALVETCCTVWDNVWTRGRLAPGETLMVHGGGSGIGVTAIQIARALGHTMIVTAGTEAKAAQCLVLGASHAIVYSQEDFVERAKELTAGRGVDVILDLVGGPYLERNLRALALEGRLSIISVSGGAEGKADVRLMMQRRLTVTASTLRARPTADKASVVAATVKNVWPLVEQGKVRPIIDSTAAPSAVESAHARMAASGHFGKLIIDWTGGA